MEANTIEAGKLYTLREVADHLRKHVNTVKTWAVTQQIEAVKVGRTWRVKGAEVQRLANGGGLRPKGSTEMSVGS